MILVHICENYSIIQYLSGIVIIQYLYLDTARYLCK